MKFRSDRTRIAIVGSAFRMPGVGSEGFWEALLAGRDLVSQVDPGRWAAEPYLHPRKSEPGTSYTFAAGSIGDVSGFDAAFFGISPREAEQMDPQQRLLLEMAWEAFENASIRPSSLRGSRCGVYVGLSSIDYAYRRADDLAAIDATTMTGNTGSIAANRISYLFDLRGPSMTIDTACSSSLVALHQACQSIRHGESDAALVGGISLHLHPYAFVGFSKASMLSPHGRCAVFDEQGDGYVRAEGGAIVLLKPLAQAIADGNSIAAVILETGTNNDGRKSGLTVPSHSAQARLLREIYERAGIAPADIDYLEAHGTGTAVGDPIEARGIGEALGRQRPLDRPLPIGSVKSQVGHLEAASGMAGLIKVLHVLQHRRVPANLHFGKPNPHIDFAGWNLAPVTVPLELDADRRIIVGVSAFGFGGTNAHAVLSSFETSTARPKPLAVPSAPLMLSARSAAALKENARRMARFLRERGDLSDYDIAYSAMFARDIQPHRLLASATDRAALAQALDRFAEAGAAPEIVTGKLRHDASAPAFIFSGNGSQWVGMGVQLLDEEPVFRGALEEIDGLLATRSGRSVIADLRAAHVAGHLDRTEIAQPALFALQVGLTRLFDAQGIRPVAVCGHSVGEVAAAWASGALTLDAAVRVIHERSAHQAVTRGSGCMAAVELGAEEIGVLLSTLGLADRVVVAAVNSPSSLTLAGDDQAITQIGAALARRQITFRRLALDYAFHSATMDGIRDDLLASLEGLESEGGTIPLYSTVTGAQVDGGLDARYWWRNVREPVRFHAAIRAMMNAGINTFVEIGPRPVLVGYLNEIARSAGASVFVTSTLSPKERGGARIRSVAHQLELTGALHDPARLFPVPGRLVQLPHYAWQREAHWHPSSPESLGLLSRRLVHPLLGYALGGESLHWENTLDATKLPALADHVVGGAIVFPAAGFIEMALAAGAARRPAQPLALEDFEILAPLVLDREHSKVVRLRVSADDGAFTIVSRDRAHAGEWRTHAVGRLVDEAVATPIAPVHTPARPPDVTAETHYALARSVGLEYGPAFQSVSGGWLEECELVGALALPACVGADASTALLHPAYLDGAFQLLMDFAQGAVSWPVDSPPTFLPVRIDRLELIRAHSEVTTARVTPEPCRHRSRRSVRAEFSLHDATGAPVALARGVRFRATSLQRANSSGARWINMRAVPMPRRTNERAPDLPSPAAAADSCARQMHAPARLASRRRFANEVEPLLDVLCAAFAERALREISDGAIDPQQWVASGRVSAEALPLLRGLVPMLAEEGVLTQDEDGRWRVEPETGAHFPEPQDIWRRLLADYPDYSAVIVRTGMEGARLSERLRTGLPAERRERHFAESAFSWVDACTREEAAALIDAVNDVLSAAVAGQPPEGRLRLLHVVGAPPHEELGLDVLPALDRDRSDFVIAAPTHETLKEWQARYPAAARLPSQLIDLDGRGADALEGSGGRFDIVALTDGLAGAPDPVLRLSNARRLLYAGGLMVIVEQHASRAEDLRFGASPSWWRSEETGDRSVRSRRCAPPAWASLLAQSGFENIEVVLDAPEATTGPYVLFARTAAASDAAVKTPVAAEATVCPTWIVACDASGYSAELAGALAAELQRAGQALIAVTSASEYSSSADERVRLDVTSAAHWTRLLDELQRAGRKPHAWIHLAGLDLSTANAPSAVRLRAQAMRASVLTAWLQACSRGSSRPACWVVGAQAGLDRLPQPLRARDAAHVDRLRDAALWGLTRVAIQEFADLSVRWVDLIDPLPCASSAAKLATEMLEPDAEDEILLTAAGRFAPRLASERELPASTIHRSASEACPGRRSLVQLDFSAPGPFRNLLWRPTGTDAVPAQEAPLGEGEVEIDVRAAGLNFRDVMYAMGLLPEEAIEDGFCGPTLGMEVAGVVTRTGPGVELAAGEEVIAVAPAAFASRARTRAFAVARKPAGWSFAAAATVPTAFFTAYYALTELARLQPGERLLIHGAAGGVGIAAIQVAKLLGAEVFGTAGTVQKRDFVRLLGADQVFDSRSLTFSDDILRATGAGVDVVLNSLAGEAMRRSLRLLKPFGRMVELGKRDFYENSRLGLRPFRNNIAYFGFDADQLMAQRPAAAQRVFQDLMKAFAEGTLRPLPYRAFCATQIEAAFHHMQASRHVGKVVVTFPNGFDPVDSRPAGSAPAPLRPDATYLVTGGLTGFGLRTAWWLAHRGARHLALVSRRGIEAPGAREALAQFAAAGIRVQPIACDVADAAAVREALAGLRATHAPLKGIVHAAAVIEDALIRDLSAAQLQRVLAPKIAGALNLHEATGDCDLDFFLVYSSATTLFGNPGQGAYVAANLALESFAAERRAMGLPATCVSWGPIGDVGYLARHERVRDALVGRIGGRALAAEEALRALDVLVAGGASHLGHLELDWSALCRFLPAARAPKFSELARLERRRAARTESAQDVRAWLAELPETELLPALTEVIRKEVAQVLRIAPERIEPGASLLDMGMDSLMAVELAMLIEGRLGVQLSALTLSDAPTLERLAARFARELRPSEEQGASGAAGDGDLTEQVRLMAALHASEVSETEAAGLEAEVKEGSAPGRLTAGQRS